MQGRDRIEIGLEKQRDKWYMGVRIGKRLESILHTRYLASVALAAAAS
jgi:hypothetical protein